MLEEKGQEIDLEEDSFSMIALCATNGFSTRKCWIGSNILQDLSALPNRVMYLISIDTVVLSNLLHSVVKKNGK